MRVPLLTTADALLADILADPLDDTPRLVYADWLEEHGSERDGRLAAFLREGLACPARRWTLRVGRSERGGEGYDSPDGSLPSLVGLDLRWPVPATAGAEVVVVLRRGLVAEVVTDAATFLELAPSLFAAHPLEWVELTDRDPVACGEGDEQRWAWWYEEDDRLRHHRYFIHAAMARADLSRACVAYGRSLAGLPLFPSPGGEA